MRPNNEIHLSRRPICSAAHTAPRTAFWLVLCAAFVIPSLAASDYAEAQAVTKNQFVGARVESGAGYLTIYKGDPANNEQLTFFDESFLTVKVQGLYYSNSPFGGKIGPNGTAWPIDVKLDNGQTSNVGDTIRTVWKETGFDIVQDAYPVTFSISGVIVLSVKIVNHLPGSSLQTQAQFLLDNLNTNMTGGGLTAGGNDNPYLINRYGYIRNWQDCAPSPIPSFFLAFEFPPDSVLLGTVGIGYVNDSFPPRPLGLMPLSFIEFGDWVDQGNYTWGPPSATNGDRKATIGDEATLMMGKSVTAGDDVTEIMRTAYGTPEWCYDHGKIVGFALYPHHLFWNPITLKYSPNPFQVETFLFNVESGSASGVTIRQTVGDPIRIMNPKPIGLSKDTTQKQTVGTLPGWNRDAPGGVADVRWTDEVIVLPTGCASSFPVDILFDVKVAGIDTVFTYPWNCPITVDCANPDTVPPLFQNTFAGCDSIKNDTVTVHDNEYYDLGLDTITYSSPDLNAGQYFVTITPPPPFNCTKKPVKIYVQQIDTFQKGHVIFTFTDCANNVSRDTLCFTAHPPLPDITAPQFWDSAAADCHALCRQLKVTDSIHGTTSIDRGVDVIDTVSNTNMTLTGAGTYKPGTSEATIRICVTDSMQDGKIVLRATDTARNVRLDTILYCTTADTKTPIATWTAFDPVSNSFHVHVSDTQAWDRGIDSVWIDQAGNVATVPSPLPDRKTLACRRTFDFDLHVLDTTKCAHATVHVLDCASNLFAVPIAFSKNVPPVITASTTLLCSDADVAILDAGGNYASYFWSPGGQTTRRDTVHNGGSYTVAVDDGEGCPSTSDPITITKAPATPVISPATPAPVCEPDSTLLDAGSPYVAYQWLKDGVTIPGATKPTFLAGATGSYTVQVTNAAGCSGTSPAVQVTINPLPAKPVITAANNVLTASSVGVTYQWSLDGTPIPGATSQSYTALTGGNFTVTIDSNNCTSTSLPYSNAGSTLIALPAMVVAHESDHITLPLSIVTSQSFAAGSHRPFTVTLSYNKTLLVPDPSDPNFSIGVPGTVQYSSTTDSAHGVIANLPFIAALGTDSCTTVKIVAFSWSTSTNISITTQNGNFCLIGLCTQGGTRYLDPEGKVLLSEARPNPAFDNIQIDYQIIERGPTTLVISDLLGREVLRLVDADQQPGTYSVAADVSSLPTGTYVYSLRTPTTVKSNHLQITR